MTPIPHDIKQTLLDALKTDREEWGDSAENRNAVLWLRGELTPGVTTPTDRAAEVDELHQARKRRLAAQTVTYAAVIALLRSMAVDGYMPRHVEYDAKRPRGWPTGGHFVRSRNVSWAKMAVDAGLKLQPKGGRR